MPVNILADVMPSIIMNSSRAHAGQAGLLVCGYKHLGYRSPALMSVLFRLPLVRRSMKEARARTTAYTCST